MVHNSPRPREQAQKLIKAVKESVTASLDTCLAFAEAWTLYEEGAWSNKDLQSFLSQLHAAHIGPDPETLTLNTEDRYAIGASAGTFHMMKTVGESLLLQDKDIKAACLINSRSSLFALIKLYEDACKTGGGSVAKKEERAREKVLGLLTEHGEGLTRKLITAARNKLKKQRQSHKPKELPSASTASESGSTLPELVESGVKFQEVLLTPSNKVLDQIEGMSFADLEQRLSVQSLLAAKSVVNVVVPGNRLGAIAKIQDVLRLKNPKLYCLRADKSQKYVLDLSKASLLFSNQTLDVDAKPKNGEQTLEFIQRMTSGSDGSTRLHLFAEEQTDGWVSCVGDDASWKVV